MKKLTFLFILFFNIFLSRGLFASPFQLINSDGEITYHVITDDSKPATNILITTTTTPLIRDKYVIIKDKTDSNGNVTIHVSSPDGWYNSSIIDLPGYYPTGGFGYMFTNSVGGKWQPWNPTIDVVVKPILNPIAMYASNINIDIPAKNIPVGFDLEASDWVAPYGKGSVSDFIFTMAEKIPFVYANLPYDVTNTLSFRNKGDGIQSVISLPLNQGSALRLPRFAPEGGYEPTLVQELSLNGNKRLNGADGENQNYFFRVRTVLDEKGQIKNALYGKVAGPVICGAQGIIQFTYYLNPTPNDRNMEFDPKKNLFQNLPPLQQVRTP